MTSAPAVRTDSEPITKRFPALGTPEELHWLGAAAGQDGGGVPGPTDVQIQGLIVLSPEVVTAATKDGTWTTATPTVPESLRTYLPTDPRWQTNDEFTTEVSTSRYSGDVYLDPASRTLYLDVIGG